MIKGWIVTNPILDSDDNVFAPPRMYDVVGFDSLGGHTYYQTNATVTDYDSDFGYPLVVVDTMVAMFIPL